VAAIQALTLGHAVAVQRSASGAVHSVFPRAVNLEIDGDLWTLLTSGRDDLPFGVRTACAGFDALGLVRGDRVAVRAGYVGIAAREKDVVVDCRAATRWIPARTGAAAPGLHARLGIVADAAASRAWHGSARMAQAVVSALQQRDSNLDRVLRDVVGCGAGSTPAGDDVLVGIFSVLTSTEAGARAAAAAQSLDRAMRPLLRTTPDISAHLLRQAARGFVGRCVHELVCALAGAAAPQDLVLAARRILDSGATSGADTCMGLLASARVYLQSQPERAAA
jgi:hypothetical protein